MNTAYNALIRRPWMHKFWVIPSTYHRCIKYSWQDTQGTIVADNNPFQAVDAYFVDSTYYQKTDPWEIPHNTPGNDNDNGINPQKLKVRHGINVTKDEPILLPNAVTQNFILPLAQLSAIRVNSYWSPSIFLPEGPIQSEDHPDPISERELKDSDNLLPHIKLAPQLLQSCDFDQQGKWKNSYKGKEVLTQ